METGRDEGKAVIPYITSDGFVYTWRFCVDDILLYELMIPMVATNLYWAKALIMEGFGNRWLKPTVIKSNGN